MNYLHILIFLHLSILPVLERVSVVAGLAGGLVNDPIGQLGNVYVTSLRRNLDTLNN